MLKPFIAASASNENRETFFKIQLTLTKNQNDNMKNGDEKSITKLSTWEEQYFETRFKEE